MAQDKLHQLRRCAINARDLNDHWMVVEYGKARAKLSPAEAARFESEASIDAAYQQWAGSQPVAGSSWSLLATEPHLF